MIQGFNYSGGPFDVQWHIPSSAFSKGDVLMLDSTSSVSRQNILMTSDIYGFAMCDSNQSVQNQVPVLIPGPDTELLGSLDTALTSHVTTGVEGDLAFGAPNGRHYFTTSANSVRFVVKRGTSGNNALSQSIHSQVIVRLVYNAGNLDLS